MSLIATMALEQASGKVGNSMCRSGRCQAGLAAVSHGARNVAVGIVFNTFKIDDDL